MESSTEFASYPECIRCHRKPSLAGCEIMVLIPLGSTYLVACSGCTDKLMEAFGIETELDLGNLFTHADNYNETVISILRIKEIEKCQNPECNNEIEVDYSNHPLDRTSYCSDDCEIEDNKGD